MNIGTQNPVIVCAADNRYVRPLVVMLRSLADNLQRYRSVAVWVLDGGISRRNKRRIIASLDPARVRIQWVVPDDRVLKKVPVFGHVSICTYYRLLLANVLPQDISKVIYLDVDTVVSGDIGEMWDASMQGKSILAVPEEDQTLGGTMDPALVRVLSLNGDAPYFNAGVIVVNLARWRESHFSEQAGNLLERYGANIRYWDQDVLNSLLANDWAALEPKWNQKVHHLWVGDAHSLLPGIVHFASSIKPWDFGVAHAAAPLYFQWLDRTLWAGWRPRRPLVRWAVVRSQLADKHWYGKWIRRLPVLGYIWVKLAETRRPSSQPLIPKS